MNKFYCQGGGKCFIAPSQTVSTINFSSFFKKTIEVDSALLYNISVREFVAQ